MHNFKSLLTAVQNVEKIGGEVTAGFYFFLVVGEAASPPPPPPLTARFSCISGEFPRRTVGTIGVQRQISPFQNVRDFIKRLARYNRTVSVFVSETFEHLLTNRVPDDTVRVLRSLIIFFISKTVR